MPEANRQPAVDANPAAKFWEGCHDDQTRADSAAIRMRRKVNGENAAQMEWAEQEKRSGTCFYAPPCALRAASGR